MKIKGYVKFILVFLLVALAIYLVGKAALTFYGYCYKEKRFLADEEIIHLVVERVIRSYPPVLDEIVRFGDGRIGRKWYRPEGVAFYKSKEEFFKINKNCCELTSFGRGDSGGNGKPISLLSKLTGNIFTYVRVRYQIRFKGTNKIKEYESYYAVSNCGHVWSGI